MGGLGTTAAFVAAVVVIAKDAKSTEVGPDPESHLHRLFIKSTFTTRTGRKVRYQCRCNVVLPGGEFIYESDDPNMPLVAFRDNPGTG